MEMTARVTADAVTNQLKSGKQVVNFSVAINDRYKTKGSDTPTNNVTYVQCNYWVNPGIASYLTKGTLVELQGRIGANAFAGKDGEPKAALTFHVNSIQLHGGGKAKTQTNTTNAEPASGAAADDLPF